MNKDNLSWFEIGYKFGYFNGIWNREVGASCDDPCEFPSIEALTAYRSGYDLGYTDGVLS